MSLEALRTAVPELGLADLPVMVHSGLRAHEPAIDANDLLDALLEYGVTVMVPTFTYDCECAPPVGTTLPRNGEGPGHSQRRAETFDVSSRQLSLADMGQFPASVLARTGRAAIGPLAADLVTSQTAEDVYAPLRALIERNGRVLMANTDLRSLTLVHLAESVAGRNLFIRWSPDADGKPQPVRVGSCSAGFLALETAVSEIVTEARVCGRRWWSMSARDGVEQLADAIRMNPQITHCGRETCARCRDACLGGPPN